MSADSCSRVIVIGCGFAGLAAVRALNDPRVRVTVIDRANHHLFQPLLYQVATAGLSAPEIAAPIRNLLRDQRNATVLLADVRAIDTTRRRVILDDGSALEFDQLIVATGATHGYFGHDDWAAHAPGLKTLDDAFEIRRRILTAFERAERETDREQRRAWLTFAVIGAGPTGVELAGTLAEIARRTLPGEFRRIDPRDARVVLIEGSARVLGGFDEALSRRAREQLEALGVEVALGARVGGIDAAGVTIGDQRLAARTVMWAAGVAASPLGRGLGAALDAAGRVKVSSDLSLPHQPHLFVAGDLAWVTGDGGAAVPGVAPAAKQMGAHAARNVLRRIAGRPTLPFVYRDAGSVATIGRKAAVARIGALRLSGLPAWLAWLLLHIWFLIGFRNRVVVLMDWAVAFFAFRRHARVVTGLDTGIARLRPAQTP